MKLLVLKSSFCYEIVQLKKEVKVMLDFAQGYMLKVSSPDQENSNLAQQDNTASDAPSDAG